MKKLILNFLLAFSLVFGLGNGLAAVSAASPTDAAKASVCLGLNSTGTNCRNSGSSLTKVVKAILNIISVIAGVTAVIMIMVSGFKYITSQGEAQQVASAKHTLIYAIVGLTVVAFAQFIVFFVLRNVNR